MNFPCSESKGVDQLGLGMLLVFLCGVLVFLSSWPTGVQLVFFFCSGVSRLFGAQGSPSLGSLLNLCILVFDSSGCLS